MWTRVARLLAQGSLPGVARAELRSFARDLSRALTAPEPDRPDRAEARGALYAVLDALTDGGTDWPTLAAWVNTYARQRPGRGD